MADQGGEGWIVATGVQDSFEASRGAVEIFDRTDLRDWDGRHVDSVYR